MYYYEISWSWHDDYVPFTLSNEKYFDNEEFKKIVDESAKIAYEKLFFEEIKKDKQDKNYIGFCRWDEISNMIIEDLKKYGFEKIKIASTVDYFGLFILEAYDIEAGNKSIKDVFKDELIDNIIKHNKMVEEKFFEPIVKEDIVE